jgi:hypothetical protein
VSVRTGRRGRGEEEGEGREGKLRRELASERGREREREGEREREREREGGRSWAGLRGYEIPFGHLGMVEGLKNI